jgi:uncharacterized protein
VVIAKAPIPGLAKTRIARTVGDDGAAALAAAALLDTLESAASWSDRRLLCIDGAIEDGCLASAVADAAASWEVVGQPAGGLDVRLAAALATAGRRWGPRPVLLVGMDTPQATASDFEGLDRARRDAGVGAAAIGPADDGGWWGLAVSDPALGNALVGVEMSTSSTCAKTESALAAAGAVVRRGSRLRDMDTVDDARAIAAGYPRLRIAQTLVEIESAVRPR